MMTSIGTPTPKPVPSPVVNIAAWSTTWRVGGVVGLCVTVTVRGREERETFVLKVTVGATPLVMILARGAMLYPDRKADPFSTAACAIMGNKSTAPSWQHDEVLATPSEQHHRLLLQRYTVLGPGLRRGFKHLGKQLSSCHVLSVHEPVFREVLF